MSNRDLNGRIQAYRRRYRKTLQDLLLMLPKEIEHIDDEIFEPSSAIESALLHVIQEGNRLKSLLEVEE